MHFYGYTLQGARVNAIWTDVIRDARYSAAQKAVVDAVEADRKAGTAAARETTFAAVESAWRTLRETADFLFAEYASKAQKEIEK